VNAAALDADIDGDGLSIEVCERHCDASLSEMRNEMSNTCLSCLMISHIQVILGVGCDPLKIPLPYAVDTEDISFQLLRSAKVLKTTMQILDPPSPSSAQKYSRPKKPLPSSPSPLPPSSAPIHVSASPASA